MHRSRGKLIVYRFMESSDKELGADLFTVASEIREAIIISVAVEDIAVPKDAQLLDQVSIQLVQLLDRWIHSMEGKQDAALVGALASAEIPHALADIWLWWLSVIKGLLAATPRGTSSGRMAVPMPMLLFPVLRKSVEVMGRMGSAIKGVLGKSTAVANMQADAPERYRTAWRAVLL